MIAPMETGAPAGARDLDLRDDIERTRADLGRTLQELMARVDVRSRARASASQAADRMRAGLRTPAPWVALAAGAATVVLLASGSRLRQRMAEPVYQGEPVALRRRPTGPAFRGRRLELRGDRGWRGGTGQPSPWRRWGAGAVAARGFAPQGRWGWRGFRTAPRFRMPWGRWGGPAGPGSWQGSGIRGGWR